MSPHPVASPDTPSPESTTLPLYQQIALRMAQMVASGALKGGQRLPSVRDSAVQNGVSVSTVVQAFGYLEERGLVQPRPKAGYFVAGASKTRATELVRQLHQQPAATKALAGTLPCVASTKTLASFAGYSPKDADFFHTDRIRVALSRATRLKRDTLISTPVRRAHLRCAMPSPCARCTWAVR